MTYTGLELFIDDLKHLIYSNDDSLINDQTILFQRPQIRLLCEELESVIQTLFVDRGHNQLELEEVKDLKKRFKDTAEEAQDVIDLFVSSVDFRNRGHFSDAFTRSLNLENIMTSIRSIKHHILYVESLQITSRLQIQSARTSCKRDAQETKTLSEEIVVGLDDDVVIIVEKLISYQKQLDVISIVGMGGIGKTTLATKVYNDPYVVYHFDVLAWVTISQTCEKRDLFISILSSMGELDLEEVSDSRLREKMHKRLYEMRYLVVIDDIWSKETWDEFKIFFPHNDTRSRILLTSRDKEVALHANPRGFVHHLRCLTDEESWDLLCTHVFSNEICPEWLIEPGIQIAEKCEGLPLALVVIAQVLTNEGLYKDRWEEVAQSVNSYLKRDHKGSLETLALSYYHLPHHLRECFLYLGGFPDDFKVPLRRLIWLWVAEGFIQEVGNQSFEDTAEAYLMGLVDKNLLIVSEKKFNGGIKAWKVHNLVRELCLEKAEEEYFFLKVDGPSLPQTPEVEKPYKQRRVFTNHDVNILNLSRPQNPSIRSLLYFHNSTSLMDDIAQHFWSFALLRVLDLHTCELTAFPQGMDLLIHLRYLAIWFHGDFPTSICNLLRLQTLIVISRSSSLVLPGEICHLVNLRHLWSNKTIFLPLLGKPMNLQTISHVVLGDEIQNLRDCFPDIKKLVTTLYSDVENDFTLLWYLEILKLSGICRRKAVEPKLGKGEPNFASNRINFPATLRKLVLVNCRLPWSVMSIIQSLPNLEVLKLLDNAFDGTKWNKEDQHFQHLKFLKLMGLNIQQWEVYSTSFPYLRQLQLVRCNELEEIPLEFGYILTLEVIIIDSCNQIVTESVNRIQEVQHFQGNYELKITADGKDLSEN